MRPTITAGTRVSGVGFRVVQPDQLEWITRPHEPDEPARHVAEYSELAGFTHTRGNLWRYEPGARGRRHREPTQEETSSLRLRRPRRDRAGDILDPVV